jgi:hypothetical protein
MEPFGSVGGDPLVSLISGCVDISCRRSIKRPCADPNARAASHSVTQKGYTLLPSLFFAGCSTYLPYDFVTIAAAALGDSLPFIVMVSASMALT